MKPFDYNKYLKNNPLLKEGLADRVAMRKKSAMDKRTTPQDDNTKALFDAVKAEAGKDYKVSITDNSVIVQPKKVTSGVVGRLVAAVLKVSGNKVTVGATAGTVDSSGERDLKGGKKFAMSDMEGIFDYLAEVMEAVEESYYGG